MIPVAKPDIGDAELAAVEEAFESGWIGLGPKVERFEEEFCARFGHEHTIATNSGTNALDLALKAADMDGTEILVPPVTWVSTAHVAAYNDYDLGWVDVRAETLNMDPSHLEERISEETAAVIPVHYGGQPAEIKRLVEIAHDHDALVVEDCAHAPGTEFRDEPVGAVGDAGCFSFQATKPMTTGEGGVLVTDDDELAAKARRLSKLGVNKSTHERKNKEGYSWYYEVTDVGYKYFMHDISAGIGLVQLDRLDGLLERRNELAARYAAGFADIDWVEPLATKPHVTHAWYNYTMQVPAADRDELVSHLSEQDIGATVHYMPLYKHPVYSHHEPETPTTESVWETLVTLPMSSTFEADDIETVVDAIKRYRD